MNPKTRAFGQRVSSQPSAGVAGTLIIQARMDSFLLFVCSPNPKTNLQKRR